MITNEISWHNCFKNELNGPSTRHSGWDHRFGHFEIRRDDNGHDFQDELFNHWGSCSPDPGFHHSVVESRPRPRWCLSVIGHVMASIWTFRATEGRLSLWQGNILPRVTQEARKDNRRGTWTRSGTQCPEWFEDVLYIKGREESSCGQVLPLCNARHRIILPNTSARQGPKSIDFHSLTVRRYLAANTKVALGRRAVESVADSRSV